MQYTLLPLLLRPGFTGTLFSTLVRCSGGGRRWVPPPHAAHPRTPSAPAVRCWSKCLPLRQLFGIHACVWLQSVPRAWRAHTRPQPPRPPAAIADLPFLRNTQVFLAPVAVVNMFLFMLLVAGYNPTRLALSLVL